MCPYLQKEYNWAPMSLMSLVYHRWKFYSMCTNAVVRNGRVDVTDEAAKSHIKEASDLVDAVLAEIPDLPLGLGGCDSETQCLMQHHDPVARNLYKSYYQSMVMGIKKSKTGEAMSLDEAWDNVTQVSRSGFLY